MTPPRKRQDLEAIELVPEKTFEDAMRAVLRAKRDKVDSLLEERLEDGVQES